MARSSGSPTARYVVDEVELRLAALLEEDLAGARDRDRAARDLDLGVLGGGRHGAEPYIQSGSSRRLQRRAEAALARVAQHVGGGDDVVHAEADGRADDALLGGRAARMPAGDDLGQVDGVVRRGDAGVAQPAQVARVGRALVVAVVDHQQVGDLVQVLGAVERRHEHDQAARGHPLLRDRGRHGERGRDDDVGALAGLALRVRHGTGNGSVGASSASSASVRAVFGS